MSPARKQIIVSIVLIFSVIAAGTLGYIIIEGWNILDALYMTVITITTIGFKEVHNMSDPGRVFTVLLVFFSVGVVFYALNNAARLLIEGELKDLFGRRMLKKMIQKLRDHYIVCGHGRMGRIICRELAERGSKFVVIEKNPELDRTVSDSSIDYPIMQGDATRDETLRLVGIEHAKGLISVLPTDAENLYVVLSARGMNPALKIVARAVEDGAESKLMRAGANRVVSPYHIGGLRIAHTVLKPSVVDFIEFTTQSGGMGLQMEEVRVVEGGVLQGKSLGESGIGRDLGIIIVAIRTVEGELQVNPRSNTVINVGDTLVVMGEPESLKTLEERAGSI